LKGSCLRWPGAPIFSSSYCTRIACSHLVGRGGYSAPPCLMRPGTPRLLLANRGSQGGVWWCKVDGGSAKSVNPWQWHYNTEVYRAIERRGFKVFPYGKFIFSSHLLLSRFISIIQELFDCLFCFLVLPAPRQRGWEANTPTATTPDSYRIFTPHQSLAKTEQSLSRTANPN